MTTLSGISTADAASGRSSGLPTQQLDREAFMNLLVAQLQNQDPLSPTPNEEFTAQLASFSSLEQLENLNDNVVAMIALNQSNALLSQLTQGSGLIGEEVQWIDPDTGVQRDGTVDSVRIVEGIAFLRVGDEDVPLAAVNAILSGTEDDGGDGSGDGSGDGE